MASGASKRHFSDSNSSLQNSEDDEDFIEAAASISNLYDSGLSSNSKSKEEKRRLSHTAAEQKRRNAIKVI